MKIQTFIQELRSQFEHMRQTGYEWANFHQEFGFSSIPISQSCLELKMMLEIYAKMAPKHVVEIGQDHGGTFYYLLKLRSPNTIVVGMDLHHYHIAPHFGSWDVSHENVHLIEGDSDVNFHRIGKYFSSIDFAFIDGGHDYETVKKDFYNCISKMQTGVICIHDVHLGTDYPGVNKLWQEICCLDYFTAEFCVYEGITPENLGIGVVVKGEIDV